MTTTRELGRITALAGAAAMLLGLPFSAKAEVGSVGSSEAGSAPHPYVMSVIEDADPISRVWAPLTAAGSAFVPINTSGFENGDGPPSVLYNPVSGLGMVAWAANSPTGFDVVLSVFRDGAWSAPEVLAGDVADELDPFLFVDPDDGSVHLVYWVDTLPRQVMHREAPADLSAWSDPVRVSQPGEEACRPAGVVHGGVVRVAYEAHNFGYGQTPRQIVLARREGAAFIPEIVAVSDYAGEIRPQPHVHAGRFWVDWIDADNEAAWIRLDASGTWEPARREPFNGALDREFLIRRAIQLKAVQ